MVNTNDSWYQYPNSTDTKNLLNFFGYVNNQVSGVLFPVLLVVIWFVAFVAAFTSGGSNRNSAARAWTFASFIISILAIPLAIVGLLAAKFMYTSFIFLSIGVLWLTLSSPAGD